MNIVAQGLGQRLLVALVVEERWGGNLAQAAPRLLVPPVSQAQQRGIVQAEQGRLLRLPRLSLPPFKRVFYLSFKQIHDFGSAARHCTGRTGPPLAPPASPPATI